MAVDTDGIEWRAVAIIGPGLVRLTTGGVEAEFTRDEAAQLVAALLDALDRVGGEHAD
jgi:hypothetical protein